MLLLSEQETEQSKQKLEQFLMLLWDEIRGRASSAKVPSLIYEDLDITLRSVRDLFTSDVDYLIIDDEKSYDALMNFVNTFTPKLKNKISLYRGELPLFEAYGIDVEISKALEKKVWLRSGGYIIIENTEALTVIDVNSLVTEVVDAQRELAEKAGLQVSVVLP